jgi:hypothetical protein
VRAPECPDRRRCLASPTVPPLISRPDTVEHCVGQAELFGEQPGHLGMMADHAVQIVMARQSELDTEPEPMQRRVPRT